MKYDLSFYQICLFIFFSYLITNHYTVASQTYFMIAMIFVVYSFILEYLLVRFKVEGKKKYIMWGCSYCPPMFLTIIIFIMSNY